MDEVLRLMSQQHQQEEREREEEEQAREALRRQEEQRRLQRLERLSRPIPESILTLLPTLPPDECAAILRAYRSITPPPEAA